MAKAKDRDVHQLAQLFRILSDPTRLQVLMALLKREKSVSGIARALKLPQPLVSHHLGLLRVQNIVTRRRRGKHVLYTLENCDASANTLGISIHNLLVQIEHKSKS